MPQLLKSTGMNAPSLAPLSQQWCIPPLAKAQPFAPRKPRTPPRSTFHLVARPEPSACKLTQLHRCGARPRFRGTRSVLPSKHRAACLQGQSQHEQHRHQGTARSSPIRCCLQLDLEIKTKTLPKQLETDQNECRNLSGPVSRHPSCFSPSPSQVPTMN